jgi:hypothetical protein
VSSGGALEVTPVVLETVADELLPEVRALLLKQLHSLTVILLNFLLASGLVEGGCGLIGLNFQFSLDWGFGIGHGGAALGSVVGNGLH